MNTSYEKAVFCRNIAEVERVPANTDRIYYGHETCERLLPSTAELDSVLERTNKSGRALTLVTPFLTDVGLDMAESLFARLPSQTEVVCNDWGVVSALREFDLAPALGQLLIRAYKGHELDLGSSEPSDRLGVDQLASGVDAIVAAATGDQASRVGQHAPGLDDGTPGEHRLLHVHTIRLRCGGPQVSAHDATE